ncbi:MAG: methionine synthase, partial [Chloroflexi bacterium]|nr:methionine synthase [Chloroflexota bacterium]
MSKGLLTTAVGSYPKPDYLLKARTQVARGEMGLEALEELERKATAFWIKTQEDLGMDILVDGEMYRGDMVTYFSENLEGFTISGLVRSYGNRYYRKPIAVGPARRNGPITVKWWQYAQSLTSKPVKGMLTGPYTMVDWSFNEYYPDRRAFVLDMARVVHEEALDLERAGARYIQIDEPAASTRPEEMELVAEALGIVTKGLTAYTLTHICYGDFVGVFDRLVRLPVDNLDLEMANSGFDLLGLFKKTPTDKALSMGVVDVHSHVVESVD